MKNKFIAFAMVASLMLSSCATIIKGSKQEFKINSTPSQANVFVNDKPIGKTPMTTKLARKETNTKIKLTLDGYKDVEIPLKREGNGWVWGNIVFGGLIGLIVDLSDGAMYQLTPDQINAELAKNVAFTGKGDGTYIGVTLEADPSWKKIGYVETK